MKKTLSFVFNRRFIVGYLFGVLTIPFVVAIFVASSVAYNMGHWDETEIPVLSEGEASLIFKRKNAHPFLAEYDRKFGVKIGNQKVQMHDLSMNTGGRTKMNFFEHELNGEKWIRVKDRFGEYVFNMNSGESLNLARVKDIPFTGNLDDQGIHISFSNNDISTLEVSFGDHEANKDLRFLDDGVFVGSLHGLNYFTAEELEYEKIETIHERMERRRKEKAQPAH
jgi:hypothetical protein